MKKAKKVLVSACAVAALASIVVGAGALTANAESRVGDTTSWTIPDHAMTNVVTVDGKAYKVIDTMSGTNWESAGPDYIGVSNSASQIGGDTTLANANSTMVGIWASSANQVPNAFNWNSFYNLYASANGLSASDLTTQQSGTGFASAYGTVVGLKYRPEIMWSTTKSTYQTYIDYLNNGQYFTDSMGGTEATGEDKAKYYAPYDEEYDTYEIGMTNTAGVTNAYGTGKLLYKVAWAVEQWQTKSKDYDGMYNGEAVTEENATALSMNALPRTSRYEASEDNPMTARDCALAYEKLQKGSIWYVLSQIALGNTTKKKVAVIPTDPKEGENIAYVNAFDSYDAFAPSGSNTNAGYSGTSGQCFDQLVGDDATTVDSTGNGMGGKTVVSTVTCDQLAQCDDIIITGAGGTNNTSGYTPDTLKEWVVNGCSTAENKAKAEKIQYCCQPMTQNNAKNFSVEKSIYGIHSINFVYEDLFPNMELLSYWYHCIYHINSTDLSQVMQWTMANASIPQGSSLTDLSKSYSREDMEYKFAYGYEYYDEHGEDDEVINSLMNNIGIVTGTDLGTTTALSDNGNTIENETDLWANIYYNPSKSYASDYKTVSKDQGYKTFVKEITTKSNNGGGTTKKSSAKKQTIKAKKKVTAKVGKKATVKVKNAKTKLVAKADKKSKKALKVKVKGKKKVLVTATKKAQKGKTYTVKVYAKKSGSYAKSNVVKIKVKVK